MLVALHVCVLTLALACANICHIKVKQQRPRAVSIPQPRVGGALPLCGHCCVLSLALSFVPLFPTPFKIMISTRQPASRQLAEPVKRMQFLLLTGHSRLCVCRGLCAGVYAMLICAIKSDALGVVCGEHLGVVKVTFR